MVQSARGRNITGNLQAATSGSGTLRLHDSPPPNPNRTQTASASVPSAATSSGYATHANSHTQQQPREFADHARTSDQRKYSAGNGVGSDAYAARRAKREYDELDQDDIEMETGARGPSANVRSGAGKLPSSATYAAGRGQTARSLSPLEDDDVVMVNAQPNGPSKSASPRDRDLNVDHQRDIDHERSAAAASKGNSPQHSAHSTPPMRKVDADRERWEAVLNGKRDRVSAPGSGTRSPNENVKEVEPAR